MGGALLNLTGVPSLEFIVTPFSTEIIAEFSHRPGMAALHLKADLGAYLVASGVYTDPAQVDDFDYDTGGRAWQSTAPGFANVGNGIPDAAEFMALQTVLQTPSIGYGRGAVSHRSAWQLYELNLAQAMVDLSAESAAVQRAVAAYWTVADWGHQEQVDVLAHFAVTLDASAYHNQGKQWFYTNKDMDHDGMTNLEEWQGRTMYSRTHQAARTSTGQRYLRHMDTTCAAMT